MIATCSHCGTELDIGYGYSIKMVCPKCDFNAFSFKDISVPVLEKEEDNSAVKIISKKKRTKRD